MKEDKFGEDPYKDSDVSKEAALQNAREEIYGEIKSWYAKELGELAKSIGLYSADQIVFSDANIVLEDLKERIGQTKEISGLQVIMTQMRLIKERQK